MYIKFKKRFIFLLIMFYILTPYNSFALDNESTSDSKVIYITFDDGPAGKVTNEILDILKAENVPATFFLIGNQIKGQENIIKRMNEEGHSLGLHSMSHKKNCIYSSNKNFLSEMLEDQKLINSIIDYKPQIIRFPFGCNNNFYSLSKSLVDLLHENDLKIYDWNLDSGDGANPNSLPSTILKKSKSTNNNIILLMHCSYINKNTVKALPSVIKYYKDNGYEFKKITYDTPEEFHYIKKIKTP